MNVYLTGLRRSGKDTAARAIAEAYNLRIVPLTEPLYDVATRYFGMQGKDRELLQRVGDAFRAVDQDWLIKNVIAQGDGLVCADIRLPLEARALRSVGWIALRVERPEADRIAAIVAAGESVEGAQAQHATETSVESVPVDLVVSNHGSVEQLGRRAVAAVREIALQRGMWDEAYRSWNVAPCEAASATLARAMERDGD